jgi:hypothetical protein
MTVSYQTFVLVRSTLVAKSIQTRYCEIIFDEYGACSDKPLFCRYDCGPDRYLLGRYASCTTMLSWLDSTCTGRHRQSQTNTTSFQKPAVVQKGRLLLRRYCVIESRDYGASMLHCVSNRGICIRSCSPCRSRFHNTATLAIFCDFIPCTILLRCNNAVPVRSRTNDLALTHGVKLSAASRSPRITNCRLHQV